MSRGIFATDSIGGVSSKIPSKYTVFSERWFLLFSVCFLNFSFGSLCTGLAPVPHFVQNALCEQSQNETLCTDLQLWLWTGYPVGFLVGAVPATLFVLKTGILPSILVAVFLSGVSVGLKFAAVLVEELRDSRYELVLFAHGIHSLTHPIGIILSPTVSQQWFPSGQRTMATSFSISAYFVGFMSSFLLTPNLVDSVETLKDLLNLNYVHSVFAVLPLLPLVGIRRSRPLIAPSASADDVLVSRRCAKVSLLNSTMLIHCVMFAFGAGSIRFVMEIHSEILCVHGYLFRIVGLHAIALIVAAISGNIIIALLTDSTYGHKKVYRTSFALVTISSCILSWANSSESQHAFVFVALIMMAFSGTGLYSVGVETVVETMFPQHPAKTTALLCAFGYVGELVYIMIASFARSAESTPFPKENCLLGSRFDDYSTAQIVMTLVLIVFFLLTLVSLRWAPRRRMHEDSAEALRINDILTTNALGADELRTRC